MAGEKATIERSECQTRRGAVERAGRAPLQRVRALPVTPKIIVDLAGFGTIISSHFEHLASDCAVPFDAEKLGLASGKAVLERDPLKEEGLLERFCRRDRKGDAMATSGSAWRGPGPIPKGSS